MARSLTSVGVATVLALVVACPSAQAAPTSGSAAIATTSTSTSVSIPATGDMPGATVLLEASGGSACRQDAPLQLTEAFSGYILSYPRAWVAGRGFGNCQATVRVVTPPGWTYSVDSVSSVGYAQLDPGAVGRVQAVSYFTALPTILRESDTFVGPYQDRWMTYHPTDGVAAPCGGDRLLSVNMVLFVDGPSSSELALDATAVELGWRRC